MGLTACGSPEEVDPKTLYSQYYIENYEIDATKAFSQMFLADVTHDGSNEMIVVNQEYYRDGAQARHGTVDILSQDAEGNIERISDWYISHAKSTYLYLTEIDGEQYLLQYFPTEYQGICTYKYEIFSLTEEGERITYKEVEAETWRVTNPNDAEKEELQLKAEEFEQKMRDKMYNAVTLIEFGLKIPSICTLE